MSVTPISTSTATTATPAPKFDLTPEYQLGLAALITRDSNFARRSFGLIKPDYFEDPAVATVVSMSLDYFEKYGVCPTTITVVTQLIRDERAAGRVRDDFLSALVAKTKEVFKADMSHREYALHQVTDFARHQALQDAFYVAIGDMDKGDFDAVETGIKKALSVGANSDFVDYNYFGEARRREQYRQDLASGKIAKNGIKTGLTKLDNLLYHGGWGIGELTALMGAAKKGKSMGLGYFAARAALQGYNVLYATLEVSTSIIADRTDACLSSTDMSSLVIESGSVANKIEVIANKTETGELRLVNFASGTLTPKQLERVIDNYKGDGIIFDMIVVDYADIMAPDVYTHHPIENSKQIWLGLRAIADKERVAVLTATQTNREGFKEATAKAEHAAEDFNKIRIADLVISINRTDEETQAGEARLFVAANRNGAGEYTMHIKQDLSRMQFITSIVSTT